MAEETSDSDDGDYALRKYLELRDQVPDENPFGDTPTCSNCGVPLDRQDRWVVTVGPKAGAQLTEAGLCADCGYQFQP